MKRPDGDETLSTTQRLLSGARWATLLQFTGQAISWLSTIFVVRLVTPQDFGLYAMLEAPLELCMLVAALGLDTALVRSRGLEPAALRAAFGALLLTGGALFLAFFLGAPLIAAYFDDARLVPMLRTVSVVFLLMPLRVVPNALLDRQLLFKSRAELELVAKVTSAAVTLALAAGGAGAWALVAGALTDRVLYVVLVSIRHPWFVRPSLHLPAARHLIAFGGIATLAVSVVIVTGKGVQIVAAPALGAAGLGFYAVAMQLALMPLAKSMPILNQLAVPSFASVQDDAPKAARYLGESLRVVAIVLLPVFAGLAVLSEPFVLAVFGAPWAAVALPLAVLAVFAPLRLVTLLLRAALNGLGKPAYTLASATVALAVMLPGSFFAARHGVQALVGLWVLAEAASLLATLRLAGRVAPFGAAALMSALAPAGGATAVLVAVLLAVRALLGEAPALVVLAVGTAAGAASYAIALSLLFPADMRRVRTLVTGR